MTHRGAEGADSKTGDGAGIMIQVPRDFYLIQGYNFPLKDIWHRIDFLSTGQKDSARCEESVWNQLLPEESDDYYWLQGSTSQ